MADVQGIVTNGFDFNIWVMHDRVHLAVMRFRGGLRSAGHHSISPRSYRVLLRTGSIRWRFLLARTHGSRSTAGGAVATEILSRPLNRKRDFGSARHRSAFSWAGCVQRLRKIGFRALVAWRESPLSSRGRDVVVGFSGEDAKLLG